MNPAEMVERRGLLFRAGDYAEKDFSMTAAELAAAVEAFDAPVPIDLSHVATVLDGKLGEVIDLEARGEELFGTVRLPQWLDELLDEPRRKVSCLWDRATKHLKKLSIVPHPHVTDAVLMAAFAAANPDDPAAVAFAAGKKQTPHGAAVMQAVHDEVMKYPGACAGPTAAFAGKPAESRAAKQIHDLATRHGADCPARVAKMSATPAPKEARMSWLAKLKTAMFGAEATDVADPTLSEDEARAAFAAIMAGKEPEAVPKADPQAPAAFAESPEYRAIKSELDQLKESNANLAAAREAERKARVAAEAAAFADAVIRSDRAVPAQRDDLMAEFAEAAELDHAHPATVSFSDAKGVAATGSRVDRLKAAAARRPALGLLPERIAAQVDAGAAFSLDNLRVSDPNAAPSPERLEQLLGSTALGRDVLARRNGRHA